MPQRILLVEDDDLVAEMLETGLSMAGYTVDVAITAAEGVALLARHSYALVLANWKLPDGDGAAVADGAANLGAKTLMMSGYVPNMPAEIRAGHQCMMKPVRIVTLLSWVADVIGGPYG
jgi:DNA-binding response OmpR family regulator